MAFLGKFYFRKFFKDLHMLNMTLSPTLWPHPTPEDHDLYKIVSTLPDDASAQTTAYLQLKSHAG